jgi:hypothetical protein
MEGQSCCKNELLFLPHNFAFGAFFAAPSLADREILQRAFESQRWNMTGYATISQRIEVLVFI